MDPRLDSHLATHPNAASSATFNIFSRLTSEEVCWVMDRCICAEVLERSTHISPTSTMNTLIRISYQMTWHTGRALSQTVFTCLYYHEFSSLDPVIWQTHGGTGPYPLVTSVLRASIQSMVKTCDMGWREFVQRHVFEVCLCPNLHLHRMPTHGVTESFF